MSFTIAGTLFSLRRISRLKYWCGFYIFEYKHFGRMTTNPRGHQISQNRVARVVNQLPEFRPPACRNESSPTVLGGICLLYVSLILV